MISMPLWSRIKRSYKYLIVLFWLILWQLAAEAMDNTIVLVGPVDTAAALLVLVREKYFWLSVGNTFIKILLGFFSACILGTATGFAAYKSRIFKEFSAPIISLMKSIPVASFAVLAIIWLGGSERLSSFVSFVVVYPMVCVSTVSGLESTDKKLLEMAEIFEVPPIKKLIYIYVPALLPYLINCIKTAFSMSWKSGVAAELIGQPVGTIGGNLYQSKIFLDTASLFAWTFVIILISSLFEKAMLYLPERVNSHGGSEDK